jgi:hypothetical protein
MCVVVCGKCVFHVWSAFVLCVYCVYNVVCVPCVLSCVASVYWMFGVHLSYNCHIFIVQATGRYDVVMDVVTPFKTNLHVRFQRPILH